MFAKAGIAFIYLLTDNAQGSVFRLEPAASQH
jgi:hypothetical protein